jgi:hypothetical protein
LNTVVIGGFSKLLKSFEREFKIPVIKTFADLRYSIGDLYKKNGFVLLHKTNPNYYTYNYNNRLHRGGFQKKYLVKKVKEFHPDLTEWENMQLNGYDRIWDCGNLVFKKISLLKSN